MTGGSASASVKRAILIFAVFVGCALEAEAAAGGPVSTLAAISSMSQAEASRHTQVSFVATVTYFRPYESLMFVEDGDAAMYVHATTNLKLGPGDRVLVRGTTHESFRSYVQSSDITLLAHGALPKPAVATYSEMIRGETDCKLVRVRALIRSADLTPSSIFLVPDTYLQMLVDGAPVDAHMDSQDESALSQLLDAEVEITGVASGHFDNKMQQTGVLFHIQSLKDVKILRRSVVDPWSLPVTPMDRVITGYEMRDLTERMRVHGTITYYEPGTGLVLQDGGRSLWIQTEAYAPLRIGDVAEATGFPDVEGGFLTLTRSEVRDSAMAAPVTPAVSTWQDLATGGNHAHSRIFDLVTVEGQVVTEVRQATQDEFLLSADGHLISAIYRHPGSLSRVPLPLLKNVPVGARVRVTGICMLADADPFYGDVPFSVLMRSFDDVVVVARPPWLNERHLMILVGLLLAAIFGVEMRSRQIERKMRRQTASLALIEQRRSRILEAMNAGRPLEEILESIMDLVSFQLEGARCWCEIGDGIRAGKGPEPATGEERIEQHAITGGWGPALGTIFVVGGESQGEQEEALAMASGLIALTMETTRLHTDLVHRSEYDQLTEIRNRFSLESTLDRIIRAAAETGGVFGLIYIDLNEFKDINDEYGHRSGDLYLQQVAARMKQQVRPGDTLARLGGDEFAALVPQVRTRAEVEEIAMRLECCFDKPFDLEGTVIQGSASIGSALYPDDATTRDGLLNCADAGMYAAKRTRRWLGQTLSGEKETNGPGELRGLSGPHMLAG